MATRIFYLENVISFCHYFSFYLARICRTVAKVNDGAWMSLAGSRRVPESHISKKKRREKTRKKANKNRISRVDEKALNGRHTAHTQVEERARREKSNWKHSPGNELIKFQSFSLFFLPSWSIQSRPIGSICPAYMAKYIGEQGQSEEYSEY